MEMFNMKLFFGDRVTTITTGLLIALIAYIGFTVSRRGEVSHWGFRTLILFAFGLVICCFAAARDGLDKTIQNAIDQSCAPGIFPLVSAANVIGCVGALLIIIAGIASIFSHTQKFREIWFYLMSAGIGIKIIGVEILRIFTR